MVKLDLNVTEEDKKWLGSNYPGLKFSENKAPLELSGVLDFDMVFRKDPPTYIIKPISEHFELGERMQGRYDIKIVFTPGENSGLPQVFETAGRIPRKENLHMYKSGGCCLAMEMEERDYFKDGFNLPEFFNSFVVPFFYAQSYYKKYRIWAWGDYDHSLCGVVQWYNSKKPLTQEQKSDFIDYLKRSKKLDQLQKAVNRGIVRMDGKCLCGSNRKYIRCHKNILQILWGLQKNREFMDIINA